MSYSTPSPSPSSRSSSPGCELDSSPPSSPSHTSCSLYIPESSPFSHPFAGSTHATRKFRDYEKKPVLYTTQDASRSKMTRYRSMDKHQRPFLEECLPGDEDEEEQAGDISFETATSLDNYETDTLVMKPQMARAKWEAEITVIVENPSQINEIDLKLCLVFFYSGTFIGYIPRSISDLNKVVVLPQDPASATAVASAARRFARAATSPLEFKGSRLERPVERTGSLDRWKSISFSAPGKDGQLKLSLAACGIRTLPLELLRLELLTSLDLRSNLLTLLPPQINQLQNLKQLDVSLNQLKFLPSELLDMNLVTCNVNANPYIQKPTPPSSSLRLRPHLTRLAVSEVQIHMSTVPSLQEYCFRVLFQPYSEGGGSTSETVLQGIYGLPLESRWGLSDPTREIMAACDPKFVSTHKRARQEPHFSAGDHSREVPMGLSVCPAPVHSHGGRPIFITHVEERLTWEKRIGGKEVLGAPVPVLWRGCSRHCLSFLDDEEEEKEGESVEMSDNDSEIGVNLVSFGAGHSLTFSDDEGMEL